MTQRVVSAPFTWSLLALCAGLSSGLVACSKSPAHSEPSVHTQAPKRSELLEVGQEAPLFTTTAHDGTVVSLESLRGKVVVLYFYPKDGTPGCTVEAENFASHHETIVTSGAFILGVSTDNNESHRKFAADHGLPFLLVPDTERTLAESYGVGSMLGMTSRVTYIIDAKGKIARVFPDVKPKDHASEVLAAIAQLAE